MFAELPKSLHTFFLPQVEQLRMSEVPASFGAKAILPDDVGDGTLWVAAIGEECLLSAHEFEVFYDTTLHEYPLESYCLCQMSKSMVAIAPFECPFPFAQNNVLSLYQDGSAVTFTMPAGAKCASTVLCFTERYLEHMYALTGVEPDVLKEALLLTSPNTFPNQIGRCLAYLRQAFNEPAKSSSITCAKEVLDVMTLMVEMRFSALKDERVLSTYRDVVDQAKRYMLDKLAEAITVERIAQELFISKSTLSKAFNLIEGVGVAQCLRRMRLEKAFTLLHTTQMSIGEIALAVGYRHQSSFCEAFIRHYGFYPSALRK